MLTPVEKQVDKMLQQDHLLMFTVVCCPSHKCQHEEAPSKIVKVFRSEDGIFSISINVADMQKDTFFFPFEKK